MRSDELWKKDGVQESQSILKHYLKEKAKCLFTSSGEHYDGMPPNHPAVTDTNADAKTLRVGSADYYCSSIRKVLTIIKEFGYPIYAQLLEDQYLKGNQMTKTKESQKLHMARRTYYYSIPKALNCFYYYCPDPVFSNLLDHLKMIAH